MKEIAQRISELRELSDISPEEMADYLDIPLDVYLGYENYTSDIPASDLFEISHKLGVDMGLLLTGEETRMNIFTVTRKVKGYGWRGGNSTSMKTWLRNSSTRRQKLSW